MGLFDLIDAVKRVSTTPINPNQPDAQLNFETEIDPSNPAVRRGRSPVGGFVSDVLRSADNRLTRAEAINVGMPTAEGMSREDLALMLKMQDRPMQQRKAESEIEGTEALATQRRSNARARDRFEGAKGDPLFSMAVQNVNKLMDENPVVAMRAKDPDAKMQLIVDEFEIIKAAKAGKTERPSTTKAKEKGGGKSGGKKKYASPEDVKNDAGLSREQKIAVLKSDFGFK